MKRQIINIDEKKCTGCGLCIPGCPEGALQIIDGKARLVGDLLCDGLGACIGNCPEGAITVEEREAEAYDEIKVMQNIAAQGTNTIKAHFKHLKDHNQTEYLQQATNYLQEHNIDLPEFDNEQHNNHPGCPGSRQMNLSAKPKTEHVQDANSTLQHWPVQLHLASPHAAHYKSSDLLLTADCVAYALGNFHTKYLNGKTLAIACPKLDSGIDSYIEKLALMIDQSELNTITVMIMQVPCCGGLLHIAQQAASKATRKIPIKVWVVSVEGIILREEWVQM